ncbi:hypothetical protein TSAR_017010 [Trichomalopsis sarcophagae]|uniref:AMP-dependent synthetase/ligase domain-containing protein n=1 Tax=Trichomalopsis sarcophagae TaxID=543379 RepID=A0A232FL61_9HYME|nr:hypothetical protein TSAR_017010 [Trichomalopsis sarcophagae]
MVAQEFVDEWFAKQQTRMFSIKDNMIIGNELTRGPVTDSMAKIVLDAFDKDPDFVFQIDAKTGEKLTFAEMKDKSVRCALWLKKQGIGKDDVVVIATPIQNDDYVPFLATIFVNAIYNPWYHELTPAIAKYFFELLNPKIMFVCESAIDMLSGVAREVGSSCQFVVYGRHARFPSLSDLLAQQSQAEIEAFQHVEPVDAKKQVGVIYFSSGTTGVQKGTMLSCDTMVNSRIEYALIRKGANVLWYSNQSWITGSNFILTCIRLNCTRILHANFDPEETSKVVEKCKVNWMFVTPSMLAEMVNAKVFSRYDYSSVEVLMTGGSKASKTILEEIHKALPKTIVSNGFGMTELGGLATRQTRDCKKVESIGHLIEGITMKVLDLRTGKKLGPNQSGELCFKLAHSMLGYWKNPTATKEMIDDEGWVHTGDQGHYDEDGEIFITDRIKQVIIMQNHHISPSQIEEILMQHPEVVDAMVVPVPHPIDVERPFAFVKRVPGAKVTAKELKDLPASYNEYFRLTGGVVFVDEFLFTATGKKNMKAMKEMAKTYVC